MAEEQTQTHFPDLYVPKLIHILNKTCTPESQQQTAQRLLRQITLRRMVSVYENQVKSIPNCILPDDTVAGMVSANEAEIAKLDENIKEAEEKLGENEIREAYLKRANFYTMIADKEKAIEHLDLTFAKTIAIGQKLDLVFTKIRLGFFFDDVELVMKSIDQAEDCLSKGADWDRRNRLRCYKGCLALKKRRLEEAFKYFSEIFSSFNCLEMLNMEELYFYTVVTGLITCDRKTLKEKIVFSPEIKAFENAHKFGGKADNTEMEVIVHPHKELTALVTDFFNLKYSNLFSYLDIVYNEIRDDWFFFPHAEFITKEIRIRCYAQFLEPYHSMQMKEMANSFTLSESLFESDLARFIAQGRLHFKIDKVNNVISTTLPDPRNKFYRDTLIAGDQLITKVTKLERTVIN